MKGNLGNNNLKIIGVFSILFFTLNKSKHVRIRDIKPHASSCLSKAVICIYFKVMNKDVLKWHVKASKKVVKISHRCKIY